MALLLLVAVLLPFNLPIINQLPFIRFLGDADWMRLAHPGGDLRHRRARPQPAHRRRRPGVARSRLLHGRRRLHRGRSSAARLRQPVGARPADVDLAARRRHRRRARRHPRVARPPCASAGCTSASSRSAWCSSASTSSRVLPGDLRAAPRSGATSRRCRVQLWKEDDAGPRLRRATGTGCGSTSPRTRRRTCSAWRCSCCSPSSPRTSSAPAPDGRCRRSATATSPPR